RAAARAGLRLEQPRPQRRAVRGRLRLDRSGSGRGHRHLLHEPRQRQPRHVPRVPLALAIGARRVPQLRRVQPMDAPDARHPVGPPGSEWPRGPAGSTRGPPRTPATRLAATPGAPPPAVSAPQRLTQMRALAREFSATTRDQNEAEWELRLLPQPLYRYESTDP